MILGLPENPMDAPVAEKKMEDEAGVCRFTNDSQSLENSSDFSSNKQLGEVGKCSGSGSGSVAQKKAYFESQYKNVAAGKPKQEDKVKKTVTKTRDTVMLEGQTQSDSFGDSSGAEAGLNVDKSTVQNCTIAVELGSELQNSGYEISCSEAVGSKDVVDGIKVQKSGCEFSNSETVENNNVADEIKERMDPLSVTENARDESCFRPGTPELCKSEEVEESPQKKAGTRASDTKQLRKKVESLKSQRATSAKRAVSTSVMKKTPTSSVLKSSAMPTPKLSLSKSITPTPKTLSKKENRKSPLTSKKPTSVESRRVAPTSLHMSLNLETTNSQGGDMRKSLIMERMGDKDIVKRAFLAFKSQLSSSDSSKPSADSEIPGKTTNTKTSSVGTPPQKKIEGGNRLAKKPSPLSSQTGPGKSRNATRVPNTVGANKSHDMANERNKVSKKVKDKVNGKAAETTQLQYKEKKEAEIKRQKPKQSQELLHKKTLHIRE